MNYRKLGRTGIQVSEIGYGAWGIGGKQWLGGNDDESIQALRRALELGLNFIDTALAYGEGHSEQLVGKVIKESRKQVHVATKVPPKNLIWPAKPGIPIEEVFPASYIVKCTETSLQNLGMESVDLQQLHVWNPEWLASDEWQRGLEEIKKSGKAKAVGISINDHQPDSALELIKTGLIDSVQVIYNIFDQSPEKNLLPLCHEMNIGVIARVPLDEGSLTGTINENTTFAPDDFRGGYFRGDRKKEVVEHVNALQADLQGVQGTLPEIALRFLLSNPEVSTVIPGMRRIKTVESSLSASGHGPLPADVVKKLHQHAWDKNYYE